MWLKTLEGVEMLRWWQRRAASPHSPPNFAVLLVLFSSAAHPETLPPLFRGVTAQDVSAVNLSELRHTEAKLKDFWRSDAVYESRSRSDEKSKVELKCSSSLREVIDRTVIRLESFALRFRSSLCENKPNETVSWLLLREWIHSFTLSNWMYVSVRLIPAERPFAGREKIQIVCLIFTSLHKHERLEGLLTSFDGSWNFLFKKGFRSWGV